MYKFLDTDTYTSDNEYYAMLIKEFTDEVLDEYEQGDIYLEDSFDLLDEIKFKLENNMDADVEGIGGLWIRLQLKDIDKLIGGMKFILKGEGKSLELPKMLEQMVFITSLSSKYKHHIDLLIYDDCIAYEYDYDIENGINSFDVGHFESITKDEVNINAIIREIDIIHRANFIAEYDYQEWRKL